MAFAEDAHAFQAGRIIDDAIFTNNSSMSAADIQSFLNTKNSTCLKNYNGAGWAAGVIKRHADAFGINPKVLLVTLQKEQGLITRADCPQWRYDTAMGFGCPDGSPCDPNYFGFERQVYQGARHFRGFYDQAPGWYIPYRPGERYIQWNPSSLCGGSYINIVNRATASLYSYTPYQPNAAALSNLYGTGDPCSAYGNRNFWRDFRDWFGDLFADPTLNYTAQMTGDGTIYLVDPPSSKKYGFPNPETYMAYGLRWGGTPVVAAGSLDSYVSSGTATLWIKGSAPTIYLVQGGHRHYVDAGTFAAWGSPGTQVLTLSESLISAIPLGSPMTTQIRTPDGTVWAFTEGQKRPVPDLNTFYSLGYSWSLVFDFPSSAVSYLPVGPIMLPNYAGVLINNDPTVYLLDGSQRWPVSAEAFGAYGLSWNRIYRVDSTTGSSYALSAQGAIRLYVKNSTGAKYIVLGGQKRPIPPSWEAPDSLFSTPSDGLISSIPTARAMTDLIRNSAGSVYLLSGGQRRPITSLDHFNRLGLSWSNVVQVPDGAVNQIPLGPIALPNYAGIMIPGDPTVYLIDGNQKWPVSAEAFTAWGMSWNRVYTADAASASQYATTAALLPRVGIDPGGTAWLVDGGRKNGFPTETILNAFGYTIPSTQAVSHGLLGSIGAGPNLTRFVQGSGTAVYYMKGGQKQWIPSEEKLYEFGGSWGSIIRLSDAYLSSLPSGPLTTP